MFVPAALHLLLALAPVSQDEPAAPAVEDAQAAEEAPASEETGAEETRPPETAEEWSERVDQLIERSEGDPEDEEELQLEIDEHYLLLVDLLDTELRLHKGLFREAQSTKEPVLEEGATEATVPAEHYLALVTLYQARLRLLEVTSTDLHARSTGIGVEGTRELKLELRFIGRQARYQRLALPEGLRSVARNFNTAPFPVLRSILILILSLVVFRAWRRWAGAGLARIREFIRATWPREAFARALASFLWYLERVRKPLEWLTLVLVIFSIAEFPEIPEPKGVTRIGAVWILLAWFAVLLVDAFATRATSPWKLERSPIRLRSLGVVATWLLVLGLGLHVASHLAGKATTFDWVFRLFQALGIPVALILLRIWRPLIKEKMQREAHFSERVAKAMSRRGEKFGFTETVMGLAFLLVLGVRRLSLRMARRTALGRTLVAGALRQRMVRDATTEDEQGVPIEVGRRREWLDGESYVASAIEEELVQIEDRVKCGWPFVGIVAERGGGKSALMRQFLAKHEEDCLLVQMPRGGADQAWAALCRALNVPASSAPEKVGEALEARAIKILALDNLHLLAQPMLGGQSELDRLVQGFRPWLGQLTMLGTIDHAAWQYLSRLREGRLSGSAVIELTAWTEGQIGELIERRAAELGIELSYDRLTLPRLFLEQEFETPEEGVRASFRRILWSESEGNPAVAMRLFLGVLVREPDGRFAVQLPSAPSASELEGGRLVTMLVLRFLVQSDGATSLELVAGLRYSESTINNSLLMITMRGWAEDVNGYYRVTWKWFRAITRYLFRHNYLGSIEQREDDGKGPSMQYGYRAGRMHRPQGPYRPQRSYATPRQRSYRGGAR